MASKVKAGAAYVELTADSAGLERGVKKSQKALDNLKDSVSGLNRAGIGSTLTRGMRAMGDHIKTTAQALNSVGNRINAVGNRFAITGAKVLGLATAGATGIAYATKNFIAMGDALDKMSGRLGASVEWLSALTFAADRSGASIEYVENAVKKTAKAIAEANAGTGVGIEAFRRLGLELDHLNALGAQQGGIEKQFEAVAEAIGRVQDQTEKTRLTMQIWEEEGTKLLPMIGDLKALKEEARQLGVVMSSEQAKTAASLLDAWTNVKYQLSAIWNSVGEALTPALKQIAKFISGFVKPIQNFVRENKAFFISLAKGIAVLAMLSAGLLAVKVILFPISSGFHMVAFALRSVLGLGKGVLGVFTGIGKGATKAAAGVTALARGTFGIAKKGAKKSIDYFATHGLGEKLGNNFSADLLKHFDRDSIHADASFYRHISSRAFFGSKIRNLPEKFWKTPTKLTTAFASAERVGVASMTVIAAVCLALTRILAKIIYQLLFLAGLPSRLIMHTNKILVMTIVLGKHLAFYARAFKKLFAYVAGSYVRRIVQLIVALGKMKFVALILTGMVAGLTAMLYYTGALSELWKAVKTAVTSVIPSLDDLKDAWKSVCDGFVSRWKNTTSVLGEAFGPVRDALMLGNTREAWSLALNVLKYLWKNWISGIANTWDRFAASFMRGWLTVSTGIQKAWLRTVEAFDLSWIYLKHAFTATWDYVAWACKRALNKMAQWTQETYDGIEHTILKSMLKLKTFVPGNGYTDSDYFQDLDTLAQKYENRKALRVDLSNQIDAELERGKQQRAQELEDTRKSYDDDSRYLDFRRDEGIAMYDRNRDASIAERSDELRRMRADISDETDALKAQNDMIKARNTRDDDEGKKRSKILNDIRDNTASIDRSTAQTESTASYNADAIQARWGSPIIMPELMMFKRWVASLPDRIRPVIKVNAKPVVPAAKPAPAKPTLEDEAREEAGYGDQREHRITVEEQLKKKRAELLALKYKINTEGDKGEFDIRRYKALQAEHRKVYAEIQRLQEQEKQKQQEMSAAQSGLVEINLGMIEITGMTDYKRFGEKLAALASQREELDVQLEKMKKNPHAKPEVVTGMMRRRDDLTRQLEKMFGAADLEKRLAKFQGLWARRSQVLAKMYEIWRKYSEEAPAPSGRPKKMRRAYLDELIATNREERGQSQLALDRLVGSENQEERVATVRKLGRRRAYLMGRIKDLNERGDFGSERRKRIESELDSTASTLEGILGKGDLDRKIAEVQSHWERRKQLDYEMKDYKTDKRLKDRDEARVQKRIDAVAAEIAKLEGMGDFAGKTDRINVLRLQKVKLGNELERVRRRGSKLVEDTGPEKEYEFVPPEEKKPEVIDVVSNPNFPRPMGLPSDALPKQEAQWPENSLMRQWEQVRKALMANGLMPPERPTVPGLQSQPDLLGRDQNSGKSLLEILKGMKLGSVDAGGAVPPQVFTVEMDPEVRRQIEAFRRNGGSLPTIRRARAVPTDIGKLGLGADGGLNLHPGIKSIIDSLRRPDGSLPSSGELTDADKQMILNGIQGTQSILPGQQAPQSGKVIDPETRRVLIQVLQKLDEINKTNGRFASGVDNMLRVR